MANKINLAVLLSGGGTTLQNFIDRIDAGRLDANVSLVISSRADAYGLVRAQQHKIPTAVVPSKKYKDFMEQSEVISSELRKHPIDLVALAGFMRFWHVPLEFEGRVMNIHPALIPAFCGKGMYGHIVHESVIKYGCKVSGCTVHFADNEYDHGPIILQRTCPVLDDDTPETLAQRVFRQECKAYPEAIQLFAEGRLRIEGRRTRILPPGMASRSVITSEVAPSSPLPPELTGRETEMLTVLALRLSTQEIELRLGTPPGALDGALAPLARKLDLHGREALIDYALRWATARELANYRSDSPVSAPPPLVPAWGIPHRRNRFRRPLRGQAQVPAEIAERAAHAPELQVLSRREMQVFTILATGGSDEDIGRQLVLKPGTVSLYIYQTARTLGLSDRRALIDYARAWGTRKEPEE